jgi:hypothetical protein
MVLHTIPAFELASTTTPGNGGPSLLTVCTLIVPMLAGWACTAEVRQQQTAITASATLLQCASERRTLLPIRPGVPGIKRKPFFTLIIEKVAERDCSQRIYSLDLGTDTISVFILILELSNWTPYLHTNAGAQNPLRYPSHCNWLRPASAI